MARGPGIVIGLDEPFRVGQDFVFFFHHVVRRQPAFALPHGDAAAGQVKADAHLLRGLDAGVELHIVDLEVAVVNGGRAAGEQQLGVVDQRSHVLVFVGHLAHQLEHDAAAT